MVSEPNVQISVLPTETEGDRKKAVALLRLIAAHSFVQDKDHRRLELRDGRVLVEWKDGAVTIDRRLCLEVLGLDLGAN
jgi:hypothetical protein